jgi:hypothetical protein
MKTYDIVVLEFKLPLFLHQYNYNMVNSYNKNYDGHLLIFCICCIATSYTNTNVCTML